MRVIARTGLIVFAVCRRHSGEMIDVPKGLSLLFERLCWDYDAGMLKEADVISGKIGPAPVMGNAWRSVAASTVKAVQGPVIRRALGKADQFALVLKRVARCRKRFRRHESVIREKEAFCFLSLAKRIRTAPAQASRL